MSPLGTWAARVEDEEFVYDGETREEAVARALEMFCEDVDAGHNEPGDYTVHVWSSARWHYRCNDDDCDDCARMEDHHGAVMVSDSPEPSVGVTVYESTDGDIAWRLEGD